MSRKPFTDEEMYILRNNPFTLKVTRNTLSFTTEFKDLFLEKYRNGEIPRQILADQGYDPDILGDRRIWGISQHIRTQYDKYGTSCKPASFTGNSASKKPASEKDQLTQLRHEVDYLKQEIEFLKKISSIRTTRK